MREDKVAIIDLNMTGVGHFEFNKNILNFLMSRYFVHLVGEKALVEYLTSSLDSKKKEKTLKKSTFFFPSADTKIKLLFRELLAIIYLTVLFLSLLGSKQPKKIFILSIIPITHFYLKILNIFFRYKLVIFLHAELESLNSSNKLLSTRYYYSIACYALKFANFRTKYFVLGKSILENLSKKIDVSNFNSIEHPYSFDGFENNKLTKQNQKINFGIVGKAIVGEKRSQLIFQLAEKSKKNKNIIASDFFIVGSVSQEVLNSANNFVTFNNSKKMLNVELFQQKILELDFILFFYKSSSYTYSASGAFFDCIKYEIPIIAIKNDFFNFYFKKYGDIGLLLSDYNELERKIAEILNLSYSEVEDMMNTFKLNIRTMKNDLLKNNFNLEKLIFE